MRELIPVELTAVAGGGINDSEGCCPLPDWLQLPWPPQDPPPSDGGVLP